MSVSGLARFAEAHAAAVAHLRCARLALAAERFRLATGRLPTDLEALLPEHLEGVPADPFDGEPMRLAFTDQGVVFYSVGRNLADDDGSVALRGDDEQFLDEGFRLLEPEYRRLILTDEEEPEEESWLYGYP